MRKTIGWVSLVLQIITIVVAMILYITATHSQDSFGRYLLSFLLGIWSGSSLGYKRTLINNVKNIGGFIATGIGIITCAIYLVVMNPSPFVPDTTVGLITAVALLVFFLIDLIDSAYQYTCKL